MEKNVNTDYELGRVVELNSELAAHCYGIAMRKLEDADALYKQASDHYVCVYAAKTIQEAQTQQAQLLILKKQLEQL